VDRAEVIDRIWERDPTLWTGADEAKWLGWLDEPRRMRERIGDLVRFADGVAEEVLDAVVLLGMGGSSLAPEVLRRTFGASSLHVLDTTHPRAIRALEQTIDLERTLFLSASKSGSTLETRSRIRRGSSSQPSHFASSAPVQSVGSRSQIRSITSARSTTRVPARPASSARRRAAP